MDILLTNDDGYNSIGFYPLLKKLSEEFSICVITPDSQKSWVGKSITALDELQIKQVNLDKFQINIINGTPADCVQVGLYYLLDQKPKLVVSGINIGDNLGHGRILSSGTVGAAMEAAIDGIRAVSTSLYIPYGIAKRTNFFNSKKYQMYENAAAITLKIIKAFLQSKNDPDIDLISINIPFKATVDSEFEITKPSKQPYGQLFHKKEAGFKLINPLLKFDNQPDGTDLKAINENKISITPISLDLVSKESMSKLEIQLRKIW